MATEIICPDCGGTINAEPNDPRRKCECESELGMDDTEVELQPPSDAAETKPAPTAPAAGGAKKVCCVCGKDVTNAKRAKDSRGYWCYDCHRSDLRKERFGDQPRLRCPECGRMVPAETITTVHGHAMCAKCRVEQDELPNHMKAKYKPKLKDDPEAKAKEKKRLIIISCVFGGLFVVVVFLHLLHLL